MSASASWRLLYFSAPTRGEQLRILFHAAKTPFEDIRLEFPKGLRPYKYAALGDASPLMFDQCPAVTSPDGHHVAQVAACMQFVGRSLGLAPTSPALDAKAMALTLYSEEIRNGVFYKLLIPAVVRKILRKRFCGIFCFLSPIVDLYFRTGKVRSSLRGRLEHLERSLRTNGGGNFFCGEEMSYADVALFDCLRESLSMPGFKVDDDLASFPLIRNFLEKMESSPLISDYLSSKRTGSALETIVANFT
eukprot:TRINITY_DN15415_c0_g2_i1.p1 TRINITY_DN15415_c0_g2~~TRINITY_DN15415_c0_g2_i1.p1  ORF type:complete len:269 (+),score=33.33 TRINITY_DN15415_c0_g2_i1:64-807(+)